MTAEEQAAYIAQQEAIYGSQQASPWAEKAFEGASTDYKNGLRGLRKGEPDQLIARELRYLQLRSRHAINNNAYARQALATKLTKLGVIETQWKVQGVAPSKGKPKTKNDSLITHPYMTEVWGEFTSNPNFDKLGDYNVAQALSNSSMFLDGVSFQQVLIQRTNNNAVVPMKLKQLPAMLHAMEVGVGNFIAGTTVQNGIRFNTDGLPVAYFFYKSMIERQAALSLTTGIPANYYYEIPTNEIVHYFHRDYAGQWLGVPQLAPVLLALYELDDFIGATVQKQKAAQAIAFVVQQTNNALSSGSKPGIGLVTEATEVSTGGKQPVFRTTGANTLYLNPGELASLMQSGDVGKNWDVLVRTELRKVATVADILYHELTGDTTQLSFSAINALLLHSRTRLEYLMLFETVPLRERPIANKFKELAVLYDKEKIAKKQAVNAVPIFKLPKFRSLDPLKDTQAAVLQLQNNLALWGDRLSEEGISLEEWLSDKDLQELNNVSFQEPTASMNQAGNVQANSNSAGN